MSGDPNWSDVAFLSSFDGDDGATTATDDSDSAHALTFNGAAALTTSSKKFGTASLDLGSGSDSVTIPHDDAFCFSDDFTVEFFAKLTGNGSFLITKYVTSGARSWRVFNNNGTLSANFSTGGTLANLSLNGTANVQDGVWHAIALERASTTVRVYVDGQMDASGTLSGALFNNTTIPLTIGSSAIGQIDELRISNGVARYNSDDGYTVPTSAFPRGAVVASSILFRRSLSPLGTRIGSRQVFSG